MAKIVVHLLIFLFLLNEKIPRAQGNFLSSHIEKSVEESNEVKKILKVSIEHNDKILYIISENQLIQTQSDIQFTLSNLNLKIYNFLDNLYDKYIFFSTLQRNPKSELIKLKNSNFWNLRRSPGSKFLLFVPENTNLTNIFKMFWQSDIFKLIVAREEAKKFILYTADAFKTCGQKVYAQRVSLERLHFPNIPKKHNGCPFNVGIVDKSIREPIIIDFQNGKPGIAARTASIIGDVLDLNVNFTEQDLKQEYRRTRKAPILTSKIYKRDIETLGALPNRHIFFYRNFDISDIFYHDKQFWAVRVPQKLPSIKILPSVLNPETTIILALIFLLLLILLHATAKLKNDKLYSSFSRCFLDSWALSLGISFAKFPSSGYLKCILLMFLVGFLHTTYYFQGELSGLLTNPPLLRGVRTLEDVLNPKITVVLAPGYKSELILANTSLAIALAEKIVTDEITHTSVEKIEFVIKNPAVVSFLYESYLKTFPRYANKIRKISSSFILDVEAVFVFRFGHPLLESFNVIINKITEAGLVEKWLLDLKQISFEEIVRRDRKSTKDLLYGGYVLLGAGLLISFITFLFEIFYSCLVRRLKK